MSIRDIKRLTSADQALMIRALYEKPSVGNKINFATEQEYHDWLKTRQ